MNNEYMLYYICAMHTFFTWLVYFCLLAFKSFNRNNLVLFIKILVMLALAAFLYDVPGVFHWVMHPFKVRAPHRTTSALIRLVFRSSILRCQQSCLLCTDSSGLPRSATP